MCSVYMCMLYIRLRRWRQREEEKARFIKYFQKCTITCSHACAHTRTHTHTRAHRSSGDPWGFHLWAADFCFLNTRSRRSWRSPYERLIGRRNKRDLVITPREGGGEAGKRGFSTQIVCSPQSVLKERKKQKKKERSTVALCCIWKLIGLWPCVAM